MASEEERSEQADSPIKYKIQKVDATKGGSGSEQHNDQTVSLHTDDKQTRRLEKIEKSLDLLLTRYQQDNDNSNNSNNNNDNNSNNNVHVLRTDEGMSNTYPLNYAPSGDYVALLPSNDEYNTDSSTSPVEEDTHKSQRKRTSQERTLGTNDDVNSLLNKSSKRLKLTADNKRKSKLLQKFDTPPAQDLGPPLDNELTEKFTKYWEMKGEKQIQDVLKEYHTPSNIAEKLTVPEINSQIYKKIHPAVKRKDKKIRRLQEGLTKATVALIKISQEVLRAEEDSDQIDGSLILGHTLNTFPVLGNTQRKLTDVRRQIMAPHLAPLLQEVCYNGDIPEGSQGIFGDDLNKSLKEAHERMQLNNQVQLRRKNSNWGNNSNNYGGNRRPSNVDFHKGKRPTPSATQSSKPGNFKKDFRFGGYPKRKR